MSKILIIAALALAWTLSCAKQDPFDQSFIEKDLRKQTAQEIHDAADKFAYEPPADGKLTEAQIANYTKVVKLGDRIRATAERYAGSHGPRLCCIRISTRRRSSGGIRRRARVRDRRAPRLPELGLNPKEHEWVGQRIDGALSMIDQLARRENDVATKLAA